MHKGEEITPSDLSLKRKGKVCSLLCLFLKRNRRVGPSGIDPSFKRSRKVYSLGLEKNRIIDNGGLRPPLSSPARKRVGFTLIELLVALVIIGVLASLATPVYIKTIEKVRAGEAITNLELIRAGEKVYRLGIGGYSLNLDDTVSPTINDFLNLDIEPRFWSYGVAGSGTTTFTATATRDAPGITYDGTITIDQGNNWGGTSPFAP